MNSDQHTNPNAVEAQRQDKVRQDTTPTCKRYEVTVARNDYLFARIEVEAATDDEAMKTAWELAQQQPEEAWDFGDREYQAIEIEEITKGGPHA